MKRGEETAVIAQLQKRILELQHSVPGAGEKILPLGLGPLETAFPGHTFPRGAIHELISTTSENAACTTGFISVILARLMRQGGPCLWISTVPRRRVFAPALKTFGLEPDRVFFMDTQKPKDTLWAIEEALKCNAVSAVVGELSELSFNDSRRLQLAVERSHVTGFIHRFRPKNENSVACVSRWKISSLSSVAPGSLPGPGFPRWNVELSKVRNGKPGEWQVQWSVNTLEYLNIQTGVETGISKAG
jgi:protein ImuA